MSDEKFVCSELVIFFCQAHAQRLYMVFAFLVFCHPCGYLNVFGVSYTAVMGSQSSAKTLVLPSLPSEELQFDMYTPHFVLLLLFSLPCQLRVGKKPFFLKRESSWNVLKGGHALD